MMDANDNFLQMTDEIVKIYFYYYKYIENLDIF